jgi:hypothetical protein
MNTEMIEEYLRKIQSVINAKVVVDIDGEINELHIVSDRSRNPKQICRDVQSVLMSGFGIDIDYKKISIAQIFDDSLEAQDFRLKFETIVLDANASRFFVKVVLDKDGSRYEGTAFGPNTLATRLRTIGNAVLKAVEEYLGLEGVFALEDIKLLTLASREAVATSVIFFLGNNEWSFCGISFAKGDVYETVVKSVLDSINRVLTQIPSKY